MTASSRKKPQRPPTTQEIAPPVRAAAARLLAVAGDADALGRSLAEVAAEGLPLLDLVLALGQQRSAEAGRVLAAVAAQAPDRDVRKAARRELHKLRGAGLAVPEPRVVTGEAAVRPVPQPRFAEFWATPSDPRGTRVAWLVVEQPLGGIGLGVALLNDLRGLEDFRYDQATRKRFSNLIRDWRAEHGEPGLLQLPLDYGRALLSEALQLNAESGTPLPEDWQLVQALFGPLPGPPERALAYDEVPPIELYLRPDYLERAEELLEEPEFRLWFFPLTDVEPFAREYQQAQESVIILSGESKEERLKRILEQATNALFTPPIRRAYRRRLEENAYYLLRSDRPRPARLALAAAQELGSDRPAARNPFAVALVRRAIELAQRALAAGQPLAQVEQAVLGAAHRHGGQ